MFFDRFLWRHRNGGHLPPMKAERLFQKSTYLCGLTTNAREFRNAIPGFCDGSWWAFSEFLFHRLRMRGQCVDTSFLMKLPHSVQPGSDKIVEHPLHRTPRTSGQFRNPFMIFTMHFKPQDLHSLLHTRVRMTKPFLGYRCTFFFSKRNPAHPCVSKIQRVPRIFPILYEVP